MKRKDGHARKCNNRNVINKRLKYAGFFYYVPIRE